MPTEVPSCDHGERKFVTGTSAKGPWRAYMCASPKGTPNQCAPIWLPKEESPAPTAPNQATELLSSIDSKLTIVVELLREISLKDNPIR